jgi:hypothetical protein
VGNATPAVRAAVARLKDGYTLRFAKGEYHFFEEGAKDRFLASVGSSTGMKKAVVHLEGLKDVTVDGGGSSFVFHGKTFPFIVERCDGTHVGRVGSTGAASATVGARRNVRAPSTTAHAARHTRISAVPAVKVESFSMVVMPMGPLMMITFTVITPLSPARRGSCQYSPISIFFTITPA